jgi:hypothetical protein
MTDAVSRRRILGLGIAAIAGCLSNPRERQRQTDTGSESTPPPATTATTPTSTESGCDTPVAQEWGSREADPVVPPCPEKPDTLDACSARAFAIALEKRRQYARAIDHYDQITATSFAAYAATVIRTPSGFIVSTRLYFAVDGERATSGTNTTDWTGTANRSGTQTPDRTAPATTLSESPGVYDVDYLVTPEEQWRAVGVSGGFTTGSALRRAGSPVACVDDP